MTGEGRLQIAVKHTFDRLIASAILFTLAPLLAAIAAAVKFSDRGPVLFCQQRAGLDRGPFRMLKFRSMIPDADSHLDDEGRPVGNRVTPVGRHLRRWSLDELPQLLNIVRGEMSFVGPRPVPLEYAERMDQQQRKRFNMRPGLTGLAQIRGRHNLPWSERIKLDVEYVENFSLKLDLAILAQTARVVLDKETLIDRGDPRKVDLG